MTFGEKIRELRGARKMTQRQLARKIQESGMKADFTYISKIENGRLDFPPSENLIRKMAEVLETDAEELLDLAGKFNQRALQNIVSEMPEAGILLRRLQNKQFTREQILEMLDKCD